MGSGPHSHKWIFAELKSATTVVTDTDGTKLVMDVGRVATFFCERCGQVKTVKLVEESAALKEKEQQ